MKKEELDDLRRKFGQRHYYTEELASAVKPLLDHIQEMEEVMGSDGWTDGTFEEARTLRSKLAQAIAVLRDIEFMGERGCPQCNNGWKKHSDICSLKQVLDQEKAPKVVPIDAQCMDCGLPHGLAYPQEPSVRMRRSGDILCNSCVARRYQAPDKDDHVHE